MAKTAMTNRAKTVRQTLEERQAAEDIKEKLTVLAQPHRQGDLGDMTDAFGTFLREEFGKSQQECMRRCWEAGQLYIVKVSDYRRAKDIPAKVFIRDETRSGGEELSPEVVERWRQEIDRCKDAMKCSGLSGFYAAENLILEDRPCRLELYGPVKRAIIQLAICLGLFTD